MLDVLSIHDYFYKDHFFEVHTDYKAAKKTKLKKKTAVIKITSASGYKSTINYEEILTQWVPDVWCGRVKRTAKKETS